VPELLRRYLRPREGWLSMLLVLVMLLTLAWSLQHADWFDKLDFLLPVATVGALAGAMLGLTRLSVVVTLSAGAIFGAGIVLGTIGAEYFPNLDQAGRLMLLRGDALDWTRIVVNGGFAPQLAPYDDLVATALRPKGEDRYQTAVESWRHLQSQNIEFTMKRLREPVGGAGS